MKYKVQQLIPSIAEVITCLSDASILLAKKMENRLAKAISKMLANQVNCGENEFEGAAF